MGHADIQTTMIYVHHIPQLDAAKRFTELVEREKGAAALPAPAVERGHIRDTEPAVV